MMEIDDLLREAADSSASDLFLFTGKPPVLRIRGAILPATTTTAVVTADVIDAFRDRTLSPDEQQHYRQYGDADAACSLDGGKRFRLNFLATLNGPGIVARPLRPGGELHFQELGLPTLFEELCATPRGIIIISGATGCGKSTTLNAMVNYINANSSRHILTIEDPIEYVHEDIHSLVTQREVGASEFGEALRSALRESPNVIVIGEMRDAETVRAAITAALTGHLVLTTLHTGDTQQAVERIIDLYPEHQRALVAADLGMALVAVIGQRLLPHLSGTRMIPALEILLGTPPVRKLVAERDFSGLDSLLRGSPDSGMITFTRAIFRLFRDGQISLADARDAVDNRDEFDLLTRGMESGVDAFRNHYGNADDTQDGILDLRRLLRTAIKLGASDLLLTTGSCPVLRLNGVLRGLELPELTGADTRRLLFSILSQRQRVEFETRREIDFALTVALTRTHSDSDRENFRFRINGFFQRGNIGIAARVISTEIPTPETLTLPPQLVSLTRKQQGLILVTGPTGSGKSTTLASLIDHINRTRTCHIITIEDPIEYVHKNRLSLLEQRELHSDTQSFANALKYALRQDPDVIMVGEMRDTETIAAALTAAETGHLVLATLHTNSAPQTIDRIIDSFPAHQQNQIRQQLSGVLLAVVSQRLLPRRDGKGQIAAFEVMVGTPPVQNLIRESKLNQLPSVLETGFKDGMITMRRYLEMLIEQNLINPEDALSLSLETKQVNAF